MSKPANLLSRPWSKAEIDELRHLAGTADRRQIATLLGRPPQAVKSKARRLGLVLRLPTVGPPPLDSIRRLHARGLNDAEIAVQLGRTLYSIYHYRRALGLPGHHHHSRPAFKAVAPKIPTVEQIRERAAAERANWPAHRHATYAPPPVEVHTVRSARWVSAPTGG